MTAEPTVTSILDRVTNQTPPSGHRFSISRLDATSSLDLTELWHRAGRVANGLGRLGITRGDRVGVLAGNSLEWILTDLAAIRLGATVAGLEASKFALDQALLTRYDLTVVVTDQLVRPDGPRRLEAGEPGVLSTDDIAGFADDAALDLPLPAVHRAVDDAVALKFTSGSTGAPKGLVATAGSVENSIAGVQELFGHGPGDNLFVFLPLSLLQQRYWIYSALAFGHDVTVSNYAAAFMTMGRIEPTVVMGVPAFFEAAQRNIERQAERAVAAGRSPDVAVRDAARAMFGHRIRYLWTGSAPANQTMLAFFDGCGLPIYEGYGMNETCIVTKNAPGAARVGSVGRPLSGKSVVIGDDLVVRVRSDFPVATRYEYAPAGASERIFREDGLVWTGDLGYLDDDGFLFLTGRADDVIVLGNGRKVIVRPIEEFMKRSPAVAECVLFCPKDSHLVAVVSPTGQPPDIDTILEQAARGNATLGSDEQIKRVVVAPEPFTIANDLLTSQHKPRRRQIFQTYQSEINESREGIRVH